MHIFLKKVLSEGRRPVGFASGGVGTLNVVQLADCEHSPVANSGGNPLIPVHPHSCLARYLRTEVLVYKGDVVRGNLIFSGYYGGRVCIQFRFWHRRGQEEDADGLPLSPVSVPGFAEFCAASGIGSSVPLHSV